MKTISGDALAKLATARGTKPKILMEIQWVADGPRLRYSDKTVEDYVGKIVQMGTLDGIIKVSEGGDSASVNVILSDTDNSIKGILDTHDIHKRPCWIYQWFEGIATADKFLIFRGEINSPIVWDEGARQVSFDVVTRIEDAEVGFSIEEGQFPLLPPDLVGQAWPMAFGNVVNVPALRITSPREATLGEGFGIRDYTLAHRIALANAICCPEVSIRDYTTDYTGDPQIPQNPNMKGPFTGAGAPIDYAEFISNLEHKEGETDLEYASRTYFLPNVYAGGGIPGGIGPTIVPEYGPDIECERSRCEYVEALIFQLEQQTTYEYATVRIIGGEHMRQAPHIINLNANGAYIRGTMTGDQFTIIERVHPDIISLGAYNRSPTAAEIAFVIEGGTTRAAALPTFGGGGYVDTAIALAAIADRGPETIDSRCDQLGYKDVTDCQADSLASLNEFPTSNFTWINQGTKVSYAYDEEVVYIANIIESDIKCVTAYRNLEGGQRLLLVVPSDYYTTRVTDYGTYDVMEVVFTKPLSQYGDGWEDDIYVTMDSTIGPNTVDIMEWLIETYTDFSIDAASFASVKTALTNYPSSFALLDRKNILTCLEEIAFQCRCAFYLRDDVAFLKYLSVTPTPAATISESHVIQNTLQIRHTPTEELVTKLVAKWQDNYALPLGKKLILRNNVTRYGVQEQEFDFYIYNRYELVEKSALFWLIRKSNTWRISQFKAPLALLALEPFDAVTLDIESFTPASVTGLVRQATYDSSDNSIDFEVWSAVRSGTQVTYQWAWPSSTSAVWPPPDEEAGTTPGNFVIPPPGHPLSSSADPINVVADDGAPISFDTAINGCNPDSVSQALQFCCTSSGFWAELPQSCGRYTPRRLDDANDLLPDSLTGDVCPGAVNLGKDPKFNDGRDPEFKEIKKIANKALATAAKAKDTAINAGGGQGGGGASFPSSGDADNPNKNPGQSAQKKVPKKTNKKSDPDQPLEPCETVIALAWFPITGGHSGGLDICLPAGCSRSETYKFGGCDGGKAAADFEAMLRNTGFSENHALCEGGYDNAPCCHAFYTIIRPNCGACGAGTNDGEQLDYSQDVPAGGPGQEFKGLLETPDLGNRGQNGQADPNNLDDSEIPGSPSC